MNKSDILHLETRRRIYNYIHDNPGLHLREISRSLKLTYFNLDYHVKYLKKLGMVTIKTDDSYSRVYCSDSIGKNEKELLNIIRRGTPRCILMFMCISVVTSQKEISENLDKHPTTIEYHLKKLLDLGIIEPAPTHNGITFTNHPSKRNIERSPKNSETLYRLKNYALIKKMFITHKNSLFKDKNFKISFEYISDISKNNKEFRKNTKYMKTFDWYFNTAIETFYEMFPLPFCA